MPVPTFMLFYVESPKDSANFYRALLEREPIEASPTFAMFALDGGLMLGLWSRHEVDPPAEHRGGGAELAFTVADRAAVDTTCKAWRARGLSIIQEPTDLDFGHTFVAVDPDGHRLRVFTPLPV